MRKLFLMLALFICLGLWTKLYFANPDLGKIKVLDCVDIMKSCGNEIFSVRFNEVPQVMKPLHLNLHMNGAEPVKSIHVDFAMQNMAMGLNRYRLIQSDESDYWNAEVTLPVCVKGRTDWNLLLEIETKGKVQRFQLPFSAIASR